MRKRLPLFLSILLLLPLLLAPRARAAELPDLSGLIRNDARRRYVQAMLAYHLEYDSAVVENLEAGYSSLFFFEGCSDNMDDPALSDIRFYRVSAVCLALRLDGEGKPYVCYFNDQCSTIPDRPLDYADRKEELARPSGPATICDGTYELYSVRHGGIYEALQIRTGEEDATIPAVYMTDDGYAEVPADYINIHTRTGNHIIEGAMWSAGCVLVGDGNFGSFTELMESVYYTVYDYFRIGDRVGTVTIDRQQIRDKMYELYEDREAVDCLLARSGEIAPERYLLTCSPETPLDTELWASGPAPLMSLPCVQEADPRSVPVSQLRRRECLKIQASLENAQGELWYRAQTEDQEGYVFSGDTQEPSGFANWWRQLFGK